MDDASALKTEYDQNGFVLVRSFLSDHELNELQCQLDRYIAKVVPNLSAEDVFYQDRSRPETLKQLQHMGNDTFFENYRAHVKWNDLARIVVGEDCIAQEPEWFNKPPGTNHPTPPHQDNYYFCLRPPNVTTLWLALDVIDLENGALRYVTGSHVQGIRPHNATSVLGFSQGISDYGPDDSRREISFDLAPGDLVAHHGNTIHRALPNLSSNRHRRAYAMVFRGMSCHRDETAYNKYMNALKLQHTHLAAT